MENKVSFDEIKQAFQSEDSPTITTEEFHGIEFEIKYAISIQEMIMFVNNVMAACFDENKVYMPELQDSAVKYCILDSYTNIDMPEELSTVYDLIYGSDLIDIVMENISDEQIDAILLAIDDKVTMEAKGNIEMINKQVSEVVNGMAALEKNLSDVFSGVDNEMITNVAGAIANGNFNMDELVQATIRNTKPDDE